MRDLFAGRVALWRVCWLMGFPCLAISYLSLGCGLAGCGVLTRKPFDVWLAALLVIASIGMLLSAIPIWRSANNYTGKDRAPAVAAKVLVCINVVFAAPVVYAAVAAAMRHVAR